MRKSAEIYFQSQILKQIKTPMCGIRFVSELTIKTYLKLENHLTSWAVLFLLNLMSGKYILRMADEGYLTQKNINLAFRRCIGVSVEFCESVREYPPGKR